MYSPSGRKQPPPPCRQSARRMHATQPKIPKSTGNYRVLGIFRPDPSPAASLQPARPGHAHRRCYSTLTIQPIGTKNACDPTENTEKYRKLPEFTGFWGFSDPTPARQPHSNPPDRDTIDRLPYSTLTIQPSGTKNTCDPTENTEKYRKLPEFTGFRGFSDPEPSPAASLQPARPGHNRSTPLLHHHHSAERHEECMRPNLLGTLHYDPRQWLGGCSPCNASRSRCCLC